MLKISIAKSKPKTYQDSVMQGQFLILWAFQLGATLVSREWPFVKCNVKFLSVGISS